MRITFKHSYKKDNSIFLVSKVKTLLIVLIKRVTFQSAGSDKYAQERVVVVQCLDEGLTFNKLEMISKSLKLLL